MRIIYFFIFYILLIKNVSAKADPIQIAWDYNCPWMCNSSKRPGFLSELVSEIFRLSNINIEFQRYSWPVAIHEVKEGNALGLLSPSKEDADGFYFPKESLGYQQMCFYINKNFHWTYKDKRSIESIHLGISQWTHYKGLMDYIHNNIENPKKLNIISSEDIYLTGFEKLSKNEFEVLLLNRTSAKYYLNKNKLNDKFKQVSCLEKEKIYLSFSPKYKNKSKFLSDIFDKNMIKLKKTFYVKKLMKKYELTDLDF
ncbi:hypothetical protein [Silvanigrella sp.]|jgi:polar amino acid transport system substrate-binding protein|uniref:hypothetical protein n=1 Tax=Silvanigrella sp. TaxID=2024976 RepID=UPI0037C794DD